MIHEYEHEIIALKQKLLKLEKAVNNLQTTKFQNIPLSFVAKELKVSRQTITYHVKANYTPEVDYFMHNNRILISTNILSSIKEHYNV